MRTGILRLRYKGVTALLMSSSKGMQEEADSAEVIDKAKDYGTPEQEAETRVHRLPDGRLCMPATAPYQALLNACKGYEVTVPGKKRKVALGPIMAGSVFLTADAYPLSRNGEFIEDYVVDSQPVVIRGRGRIIRRRPRVDVPWEFVAELEYDLDTWEGKEQYIVERADESGKTVGLLDFRPQKRGPYGRFEAERIVEETAVA